MANVIKILEISERQKQNFAMNFFTLLAFTTNGTKRTTLCEGRWLDDADGCRTVRLDSAEFPSFWLSGMTGPGGDDFVVTGGRIDASWGDECIPHTQFMTRVCPAGIEVYCDGFSVLTRPHAETPAGQSSKRGLFIDSSGGCRPYVSHVTLTLGRRWTWSVSTRTFRSGEEYAGNPFGRQDV